MASLDALEREMLLDASLKKAPVAYALWFFLGGFGRTASIWARWAGWHGLADRDGHVPAHRLDLRRRGLLVLDGLGVLAGLVWWVVDGLRIQNLVTRANLAVMRGLRQA